MKRLSVFLYILFFPIPLFAQSKLIPQTGHNGWFDMALAPDARRMVTAGYDGKIIYWDLNKYKAAWQQYAHKSAITAVEWRKDNRYFLTASLDSSVNIWDSENMKNIITYHHFAPITAAAFNPATNVLAYGDESGNVLLYDMIKNEEFMRIQTKSRINALQWTDNGFILFAATNSNGVMAYEMDQGKKVLDMPVKGAAVGLQLTPGNKLLLIHVDNGTTELFEPLTGKVLGSLDQIVGMNRSGYENYLWPAATYDGQFILNADKKQHIEITKISASKKNIYNAGGINRDIVNIKTSPDNSCFAVTDGGAGIWICYFNAKDWEKGNQLYWRKLLFEPERIYQVDFEHSEDHLTMKGFNLYSFNLHNGDLTRRDEDSAAIANSSYTVSYFSMDKMKSGIYFYSDKIKNLLYKIKDKEYVKPIAQWAFSSDNNVVAMVDENEFIIYDIAGNEIKKKEKTNGSFMLFNGNLNDYFITTYGDKMRFIHSKTLKEKTFSDYPESGVARLTTDLNTTTLFGCDINGKMMSWNFSDAKRNLIKGELSNQNARIFEITGDGKKMILVDKKNNLCVYNTADGRLIHKTNTGLPDFIHLSINKNATIVALADQDGMVHLFDTDLNKNLCHIITSPNNGLLAYNDNNYYIATKEAAQNLALTENGKIAGFEHMDLLYNRPDKVLAAIGKSDPELISAYENAYEKRLKRIHYQTGEAFDIPEVSITNLNNLAYTTDEDKIEINVTAKAKENIGALKVWVDGVPVFGENGLDIKNGTNKVSKNVKVPLLFGNNLIEVASVSVNGLESEKAEFRMISKKEVLPRLFLVAIGVSQYKDTRFNLAYADKDAKDLAATLSGSEAFKEVKPLLLTNEQVTKEKLNDIKAFLKQSHPDDIVIMFVAGHGLRDDKFDYYFATHDIDFNDPARRGISDLEMESMMDGIPALRKLLFFDTCLSGEIDKEEVEKEVAQNSQQGDITFRAAGAGLRNKKGMGIDNAQFLMKEIFNDVKRGTGATVMSSAGGAEYAMESSSWKNGLFTYCILEGLKNKSADSNKDNIVELDELQIYVRKEVTRLSSGKQYPDFRIANSELNFRLW